MTPHQTVHVDPGRGEREAGRQPGVAAPPAGHDHAVRGLLQQILAVVSDEGGGVGEVGVDGDVEDAVGGDAAVPAAYGVRDGGDEFVEAFEGGSRPVEVSDGYVHGPHANKPQRTGGTETAITIRIGSGP
ncbi:hypothetical protein GCM10020256_66840 [Streptomyces thermocoprophilus]